VRGNNKAGAGLVCAGIISLVVLIAWTGIGPKTATKASPAQNDTTAGAQVPASSFSRPASTDPGPTASSTVSPTIPSTATSAPAPKLGSALAALAGLLVKGRSPRTGYSRDQFGSAWVDVNHNSCSTREDILRRDLRALTVRAGTGGCVVTSGSLSDPYTGRSLAFRRGPTTSAAVQIDHIVSLSDAWQKGAQQWSPSERVAFANNPMELLATNGSTNASKSDNDAASWLPPDKPYRCTFVARQITIKVGYRLWVTKAEKAAMSRVLAHCPDQRTISSQVANPPNSGAVTVQKPKPVHRDSPSPGDNPQPGSVYYPNCTAVRAAGAAPIQAGEPGYSRKLDRDGDGVACE
jgi:Excalibur calcium-binding domain/Protein of unknown function (DUF1524)